MISHRRDPRTDCYFSSTISRTTLRLVFEAAALSSVRIDLAVRPCLPIIRPKIFFGDFELENEPRVSLSLSMTSTASGSFTKDFARY